MRIIIKHNWQTSDVQPSPTVLFWDISVYTMEMEKKEERLGLRNQQRIFKSRRSESRDSVICSAASKNNGMMLNCDISVKL